MARRFWPIAMAFLPLAVFSARAADNVTGTWTFTGPVTPECILIQNGPDVAGSCKGPNAEGPVTGRINGASIALLWTWNDYKDGHPGAFEFNGTVNGVSIEGIAVNGPNSAPFSARQTGGPQSALSAPPATVWQRDDLGNAHHLQTGLNCPLAVGDWRRTRTIMFDQVGFDVGCNYAIDGALITIYLTHFDTSKLDLVLEGAKRGITQRDPAAVLRDSALIFAPEMKWLKAGYSENNGQVWSDVYVSALSDWFFEFRVTFDPRKGDAVIKGLSDLTGIARQSAGAHLAACAATPPPQRSATKLIQAKPEDEEALRMVTLSGALNVKLSIMLPASLGAALDWCAENAFSVGPRHYVHSRNIATLDHSGPLGRIVDIDGGPTIFILRDKSAGDVVAKNPPSLASSMPNIVDVAVENVDNIELVALYDGEPTVREIAELLLTGDSRHVYAEIKKSGGDITIYRPY